MKTIKETVTGLTIPAVVTLALAALTSATLETAPAKADEVKVAAPKAPEMVQVQLADVIASQGNEALRQIRAESTRLVMPELPRPQTAEVAAMEATPVADEPKSELGIAIGSQGNAALKQIVAESARFGLPNLREVAAAHQNESTQVAAR